MEAVSQLNPDHQSIITWVIAQHVQQDIKIQRFLTEDRSAFANACY
jgi:hypothetical protein